MRKSILEKVIRGRSMAYRRNPDMRNHSSRWAAVKRNRYHRRRHCRHSSLKNTNSWITPSYFLSQLFSTCVKDHVFFS